MTGSGADAWKEHALLFPIGGEQGIGVLSVPAIGSPFAVGIILLTGGPQYRAGAHRHYVRLARELASSGYASFRFDARGKGDSTGEFEGFESQDQDVASAIDAFFAAVPQVQRVALFGLCDGASAAALYIEHVGDHRVVQLVLLNPWVRHEQAQAQAQLKHRYLRRLTEPETWRRLLRGRLGWRAWRGFFVALGKATSNLRTRPLEPTDYRAAVLKGLGERHATLLLSSADATAQEFHSFLIRVGKRNGRSLGHEPDCFWIPQADHTLTTREAQAECLRHTVCILAARNTS